MTQLTLSILYAELDPWWIVTTRDGTRMGFRNEAAAVIVAGAYPGAKVVKW